MTNPGHGPVELTLTRHREHCTALPGDASGRIDSFESHYDKGFASTTLSFDEFGETTYEFRLTPTDDMNVVGYKVHLQPPGSTVETGRGFDLQSQNDQAYYRGIERRPDGEVSGGRRRCTGLAH